MTTEQKQLAEPVKTAMYLTRLQITHLVEWEQQQLPSITKDV